LKVKPGNVLSYPAFIYLYEPTQSKRRTQRHIEYFARNCHLSSLCSPLSGIKVDCFVMIPLSRGPVNPGPDAAASPLSLVFSEKLKNFQGS
jgi:hypothetical protein